MRTHNLGGRGACLWFLFALFLAETLEKKEPIQTELSFGVLYECDVQLDYFFISGAEIIIFLMTLVNSAKNLVYLQNMYFFTCMMQKLPFSWSLYCWMLIIFGRIVWNLFMWNVYYMYLHLQYTYCTCTMYLSTGLQSFVNLSTSRTRKKKKRLHSFLMMLLF